MSATTTVKSVPVKKVAVKSVPETTTARKTLIERGAKFATWPKEVTSLIARLKLTSVGEKGWQSTTYPGMGKAMSLIAPARTLYVNAGNCDVLYRSEEAAQAAAKAHGGAVRGNGRYVRFLLNK